MAQNLRGRFPTSQVVVAVAGWALYLYTLASWPGWLHPPTLTLAAIFSVFPLLKFMRGSREEADERIMRRLAPGRDAPERYLQPPRRLERIMPVSEELLWQSRHHPVRLIGWFLLLAATTSVAIGALVLITWEPGGVDIDKIVAGTIWTPVALAFAVKVATWHQDYICLTNHRVLAVWGLVTLRQAMMPLKKVTDEVLQIPWHSRVLFWTGLIRMEYGTLILESAGQEQALRKITFVPNAAQVNRLFMLKALG